MDHNAWTNLEMKVLREHYPSSSRAEIAALLPRHPIGSILTTAWRAGISKNRGPVRNPGRPSRFALAASMHKPVFDFAPKRP